MTDLPMVSPTASVFSTYINPECPVCGAEAGKPWVHFETLGFDRCGGCGSVFRSFLTVDAHPGVSLYEGDYHTRKRGKRWEHRVRKARRQILGAASFGRVQRYLDVGCSVGFMVEAANRLGMEGKGTDISPDAVERARSRGLDVREGSLESLPFEDGAFDLVSMRHVLEHTRQPKLALAELHRVLSAGGLALIAVPDLQYWKGSLQRRTYRYFRPDDLGIQHDVYYTEASLGALLEREGFVVLARSKAFRRPAVASRSPLHGAWELLRTGAYGAWCRLGRALRLRRELWFIVRKA